MRIWLMKLLHLTVALAALQAIAIGTAQDVVADVGTVATNCDAPDQIRAASIDRKFTQLRYISGMSQPLRSEGLVQVTEGRISWHMTVPFDVETIITAEGIFQSVDGGAAAKVTGGEAFGAAVVQSMVNVLQGNWESLLAVFEVEHSSVAAGAPWEVLLRPRDAKLLAVFDAITVTGCTDVTDVEITHPGGDREVIHFEDQATP